MASWARLLALMATRGSCSSIHRGFLLTDRRMPCKSLLRHFCAPEISQSLTPRPSPIPPGGKFNAGLQKSGELSIILSDPDTSMEVYEKNYDHQGKLVYPPEYFNSADKILAVMKTGPSASMTNVDCAGILVHHLLNKTGADGLEILKMLKRQPHLLQVPQERWVQYVQFLLDHGFRPTEVVKMISLCPALLTSTPLDQILDVFVVMRKVKLGEKMMLRVMRYRPAILTMKAEKVQLRIDNWLNIFSRKEICEMMPACPNMMTESWEDLLDKVHYVMFKYYFEQKEIVKCRLLSYTLNYIKIRYEVAKRTGIFRPHYNIKKMKLIDNPSLRDMVDSPDTVFAGKVCGISLREYYVFQELLIWETEDKEKDREEEEYYQAMRDNWINFQMKASPGERITPEMIDQIRYACSKDPKFQEKQ